MAAIEPAQNNTICIAGYLAPGGFNHAELVKVERRDKGLPQPVKTQLIAETLKRERSRGRYIHICTRTDFITAALIRGYPTTMVKIVTKERKKTLLRK